MSGSGTTSLVQGTTSPPPPTDISPADIGSKLASILQQGGSTTVSNPEAASSFLVSPVQASPTEASQQPATAEPEELGTDTATATAPGIAGTASGTSGGNGAGAGASGSNGQTPSTVATSTAKPSTLVSPEQQQGNEAGKGVKLSTVTALIVIGVVAFML